MACVQLRKYCRYEVNGTSDYRRFLDENHARRREAVSSSERSDDYFARFGTGKG
jgi:hypothetical protein